MVIGKYLYICLCEYSIETTVLQQYTASTNTSLYSTASDVYSVSYICMYIYIYIYRALLWKSYCYDDITVLSTTDRQIDR